jgi:hypothetical protein
MCLGLAARDDPTRAPRLTLKQQVGPAWPEPVVRRIAMYEHAAHGAPSLASREDRTWPLCRSTVGVRLSIEHRG